MLFWKAVAGMGFRFNKRLSIGKGIGLSLSQSGPRISIGGKGHNISFGATGTYLNLGIPGTGLSYRTKLGGGKKKTTANKTSARKTTSSKTTSSKTTATQQAYKYEVRLDEQGNPVVYNMLGSVITSEDALRVIRASAKYKEQVQSLKAQFKAQQEAYAEEQNAARQAFVTIHELSPYVPNENDYLDFLDSFEPGQEGEEHAQKLDVIRRLIEGDRDLIEQAIEDWLGSLELPVEFAVDYEYRRGDVWIDLDLPEIEDIPSTELYVRASGELGEKARTKAAIQADYAQCIFGLSIFIAAGVFSVSPAVKNVILSGYTQRRDQKTGELCNDYIITVKYPREAFEGVDFTGADPERFFNGFQSRCLLTKTKIFKVIKPYEVDAG